MVYRTFMVYIGQTGRNYFEEWKSEIPEEACAMIDTKIAHLKVIRDLRHKSWKWLSGDACKDLAEIKVPYNKVQYRPIACKGPGENEYTILAGAIEKNDKFVPKSVCSIAKERQKDFHLPGRTIEYETDN